VDLEKAFADLGIPIRDRKVVRALYNGYRLAELPAQLGWPARRVDAARFALRADQPSGKALRARLAPYRVSEKVLQKTPVHWPLLYRGKKRNDRERLHHS